MGGQVAPEGMQGLQQHGRESTLQGVLLKDRHHPGDGELAHHEGGQEIAGQLAGAHAHGGAGGGLDPDRQHDERHHAGQGPQHNFGPIFEHQGVLAGEQGPGHPPAMLQRVQGPDFWAAHGTAAHGTVSHDRVPCTNKLPISSSMGGSRTSRSRTGKSASSRDTAVVRASRRINRRTTKPSQLSTSP